MLCTMGKIIILEKDKKATCCGFIIPMGEKVELYKRLGVRKWMVSLVDRKEDGYPIHTIKLPKDVDANPLS